MIVDADVIITVLSQLRLVPVEYEFQICEEIERLFKKAAISYEREVWIGKRSRLDFICDRVGVEVKKGKPNRCNVESQVIRYCSSDRIDSLILVVERSLFSHLNESNGKKVYYLALNKLWGLSV